MYYGIPDIHTPEGDSAEDSRVNFDLSLRLCVHHIDVCSSKVFESIMLASIGYFSLHVVSETCF